MNAAAPPPGGDAVPSHAEFDVHQEEDVVAARSLVMVGIVGVAVGAVGVFFAGLVLVAGVGALHPSSAGPGGPKAASREISNIEQTPVRDTRQGLDLREDQLRELESWRWIDRDAGLAAIPIDQAIDIVVSEGAR
jgi:hypothetical protein